MILSDQDIKKYFDKGLIKIDNFDEGMLNPASYAFKLGRHLLIPKPIEVVDINANILPEYDEVEISKDGYKLMPGEFVLGQTLEKITLSHQIAMIIEGRSTLARLGIEVVQTSTFVEPDHKDSIITLEIKNNGNSPVLLYAGVKFAKGIFITLSSPISNNLGVDSHYSADNPQNKVAPPTLPKGFEV